MEDCFIICPLGEENSDTRLRSDKLLKHVFKPVLSAQNYNPLRADQIPKVGLITTQIINLLVESPLVIADLTDSNPNVFYELAIRHAVRKPYIQVIAKGQKIPFDLSGIRTIEIDILDIDQIEEARKNIESQIIEFKKGHEPESPVSVAAITRTLQDNDQLAEEIAEKLAYFGEWFGSDTTQGYSLDDNEKIEQISRKLWGLREFSSVSLDELSDKLDKVIEKLDRISRY